MDVLQIQFCIYLKNVYHKKLFENNLKYFRKISLYWEKKNNLCVLLHNIAFILENTDIFFIPDKCTDIRMFISVFGT